VIAGDADVRIATDGEALVHFLVADRTGACATIEYLGGKMVAHKGQTMPVMALTNHTYEESVAYLERHEGFGGTVPPGHSNRSLDRFVRAAMAVAGFDVNAQEDVITYAFDVLASVAQGPSTQWGIVYDVGAMRVYFRTATRPSVRFFDVGDFDYSCQTPVRILDLAADVKGDVSGNFVTYSFDANKKLIDSAFGQTSFLKDVTAGSRNALARYPAITRCVR
jgi:penicillin V acylase-like amidase (Ntn superfamily)